MQFHIIESEQLPNYCVKEMGKATSSSDLLPGALYKMYFDMATDKEKDVKATKLDTIVAPL